jgi:hypothetical protein
MLIQTLTTLLLRDRDELQRQLDETTSLEDAVRLTERHLSRLCSEYLAQGHLSLPQERLTRFFQETMRRSVATLTAANKTKVSYPQPSRRPHPPSWEALFRFLLTVLRGWTDEKAYLPPVEVTVRVDSKVLVDQLVEAFDAVDYAMSDLTVGESDMAPLPTEIEAFPEVLEFCQNLMSESLFENAELALRRSKELPRILRNLGLQVEMYRPGDERRFEKFDWEPSIDPNIKDYLTQVPALLKGDKVIRRGRVIVPHCVGELHES